MPCYVPLGPICTKRVRCPSCGELVRKPPDATSDLCWECSGEQAALMRQSQRKHLTRPQWRPWRETEDWGGPLIVRAYEEM